MEYWSGSALMTGDVDLTSPVQAELEDELTRLGFTKPEGFATRRSAGCIPTSRSASRSSRARRWAAPSIPPASASFADRMGRYASGTAPEMGEQAAVLFALYPDLDRAYCDRRIRDETLGDQGIDDIPA